MARTDNLGTYYVTPGTFGEKGGKGGGSAKSAPDTLRSESIAKVLDLISSGQIYGWDDVDPLKCVYFDDIPVRNPDGSDNHKGIELNFRLGTPDQDFIPGFDFAANFESVGTEITAAIWPIYSITDSTLDSVRLAIRIPALTITDSKTGALKGNTVRVGFDYKAAGDPTWTTWVDDTITEKFTAPQEFTYKRTVKGMNFPILVRGHRYTADSTEVTDQKDTYFYGVTEIIEEKFSYPGFALSALKAYAKQFGDRIPERKFRIKGVLCLVPSNYNPVTRVYTDPWDGTFQIAWTNNPAWILYSVLVNKDWGLGRRIKPDMVDKWALYDISKRCDELVDDGFGGTEPRYTFSAYVQSRQEASKALQSIAATFNGMIYAATSKVLFSQDKPKSVSRLIANANVHGGKFIYEGFGRSTKSSVAVVSWNDPEQLGKVVTEIVTNPEMVRRIGWKPKEVIAWGCTSRGQARRMGRWQLFSEQYENRAVSFRASLEMADLLPGSVIKIADQFRQGVRFGGRILGINSTTVTLDAPLVITSLDVSNGVVFKIWLTRPDGTLVEKTISNGAGSHTVLNFSTTLTGVLPQLETTYVLSSSAFDPPEYTVVSTKEISSKEPYVEIIALRYYREKFPSIEENYDFEPTSETKYSSKSPLDAPQDLAVSKTLTNTGTGGLEQVLLTFTKSLNLYVTEYRILYRFAGGEWQAGITQTNTFYTPFLGTGTYEFVVIPRDFTGRDGVQAYISQTITDSRGLPRPTISSLAVVNGSGGTFYGRDVKLSWSLTPPTGITDPAYFDPYFLDYEVQILTTGDVLKKTYYTTDRFFRYSAEQNTEDNAGTPLPSFKVRVRMRDTLSTEGAGDWVTLTVTNPRPATPTGLSVTADVDAVKVKWAPSTDTDYQGTVVWMGTTNSFTLDVGAEVFRGPGSECRIPVSATNTYYIVVGHYDEFSATPTNVTAYTSVVIGALYADLLSDNVLSVAEKILLVPQLKELIASQSALGTRATALGITTEKTNFDSAMTTLNSQLVTLTSPVAWDNYSGVTGPTGLVGTTLAANIRDSLEKRNVLTAKIDELNANILVGVGANGCVNSEFENGLTGWEWGWDGNGGATPVRTLNAGVVNYVSAVVTGTPADFTVFDIVETDRCVAAQWNGVPDLATIRRSLIRCDEGERVFGAMPVAYENARHVAVTVFYYDKNGAYLIEAFLGSGGSNGNPAGNPALFTLVGGFAVAPANTAYVGIYARVSCNGSANPKGYVGGRVQLCVVPAGQTAWPKYSPGPSDKQATKGAIIGQNLLRPDTTLPGLVDLENSWNSFTPSRVWNFENASDIGVTGWAGGGATTSISGGVLLWQPTTTDAQLYSLDGLGINGAAENIIRIRARPLAASPTFEGVIYYSTSGHIISGSYYKIIANPGIVQNEWRVFEFDMRTLSAGGTDWITSTIRRLRIDITNSQQDWEFDWIAIGSYKFSQQVSGGTNLIKRTDWTPGYSYTLAAYVESGVANGKSGWGITLNKTTGNTAIAFGPYKAWPSGREFTLSFTAWISAGMAIIDTDLYPDTLPGLRFQLTTTPTRFQLTINSAHADMANAAWRFFCTDAQADGDTITITDLQMEYGPLATDWMPPVEQLDNSKITTADINRVAFSQFEAGALGWGLIEAASGGIAVTSTAVVTTNGRKGLQVDFTASGAGTMRYGTVSPYNPIVGNTERIFTSIVTASATGVASIVTGGVRTYNDAGTTLTTAALSAVAGGFTGQKWALFWNVDATAVTEAVFVRVDSTGAGSGSFIIYEPHVTGVPTDQISNPVFVPAPNASGSTLNQVVTRINKASEVGTPDSSIFTGSDPDTWVLLCDIAITSTGGYDIDIDCLTDLLVEQLFDPSIDIQNKAGGPPKFRLKVERSGVGAIYTSPFYTLSTVGQLPASIFPVRDTNVPAGAITYSLYAQWTKGAYSAGTVSKSSGNLGLTGTGTSWLANAGQCGQYPLAPARANGYFNFSGVPANGNTITVNGVMFTFVTSGATGNQANIVAGNLNSTINNMVTVLNASANGSVNVARYHNGATQLAVLYKDAGTAGNAFTLAKVGANITVSGATLTGGAAAGANAWEARVPSIESNWWPIIAVTSRTGIALSNDGFSPAYNNPNLTDLYWASLSGAAYEIRANYHSVIMRLTGYTMRTTEYKNTAVI